MNYLTIENISKSYGEKQLFSIDQLMINHGDKIALVAKNGSGKTTLLRVLAGEETPEGENAKIWFKKDLRIAYLRQEPNFDLNATIWDTISRLDNTKLQAVLNYEKAVLESDQQAIQEGLNKIEDLKAWDIEAKAKEILSKLGIDRLDAKVGSLSGGQKKRLALAQKLLNEPEFLILDEPTNHLDIEMIEWLEQYLSSPNITLFLVTHDRYFLERICNEILELDRGKIYAYRGNYSDFLEKKTSRMQNEAVNLDKTQKLFKKELEWIRRQPKARGTKAKARVDKFHEIKKEASSKLDNDQIRMVFKARRLGSKILEVYHLEKSFGDINIVEEFNYKFAKGERVGIIGPNGAGKTSFIKLLTGQLKQDGGKVIIGDTVHFGYFDQKGIDETKDRRVIDVIREVAEYIVLEDGYKMTAEKLLERFLFPRPHQQVYISQLSGGEKRRLHLLQVLMGNPNFLILDEPTNDLDIITLNVLEEFLLDFGGCLIVVTHDRYFMDKLVTHLFVMEGNGRIVDFNGTYSEWSEKKKELKYAQPKVKEEKQEAKPKSRSSAKGLTYMEQKELKRLEKEIEKLENKEIELSSAFSDTSKSSQELADLAKEASELRNTINAKEERWMELAEKASQ